MVHDSAALSSFEAQPTLRSTEGTWPRDDARQLAPALRLVVVVELEVVTYFYFLPVSVTQYLCGLPCIDELPPRR